MDEDETIICPILGGEPCATYNCAFFNDDMAVFLGTYACQVFQAMKGIEKLGALAKAVDKLTQ